MKIFPTSKDDRSEDLVFGDDWWWVIKCSIDCCCKKKIEILVKRNSIPSFQNRDGRKGVDREPSRAARTTHVQRPGDRGGREQERQSVVRPERFRQARAERCEERRRR